jgi:mono/diheme cytochrome c family protein
MKSIEGGEISMRALASVGVFMLAMACNGAAPTATTYKQQLSDPKALTNDANPGNSAGDPAKGQTALAACTGCHAEGGIAHKLVAEDAESLIAGTAASNSGHSGSKAIGDAIKTSGKDMAAFLKGATPGPGSPPAAGDAAAGKALLAANCVACHAPGGGLALDASSNFDGQDTAQHHGPPIKAIIKASRADLQAALKAP